MSRLPRTLLLSRSVPPAPTGTGVIVRNLAQQFGRDEMVVLGAYYMGRPSIRWRPEWAQLKYATLHPPDGWRGARWIRWIQWPVLFLRAWWIAVLGRCRVILVVFPDEVFLLAGYLLARITGKQMFAYFHNTYVENREGGSFARWLQSRVFSAAQEVFVISRGMQELYEVNYPNLRCSALVHSFNESLPDAQGIGPRPVHMPLRLCLFGSVGESNADAASRIAQLVHTAPDVRLTVFSETSRSYLNQLGFVGEKFRIETVSRDVLLEQLQEQDIILLPHGFHGAIAAQEIATIFPTKTIEALICGRPILAHLPPTCFLARFLRDHNCAFIVDQPDPGMLQQALARLRGDAELRLHLVQRAILTARQFQASSVAARLRGSIKAVPKTSNPQPEWDRHRQG